MTTTKPNAQNLLWQRTKRKKTVNIDKIDIDKAIVVHEMINTNIQNNIQKITDIFHVFHSTSTIIIIYTQLEK